MPEASLFTRLNGNGGIKKLDDKTMKNIIIGVLVVFVLILVGWAIYKNMKSSATSGTSAPQTTLSARPNLRAVVSPVMPKTPPKTMASATPVSNEKVKVVKVDSNESYDESGLNQDTISDPDFLMGIGKDSMADVRNDKKTIDDLQYSSPQDMLGIDAVLQNEQIVQAEDKSKTNAIGVFGSGINTPYYMTHDIDRIRGMPTIPAQTNQTVVSSSVTSSNNTQLGYMGLDDALSANA